MRLSNMRLSQARICYGSAFRDMSLYMCLISVHLVGVPLVGMHLVSVHLLGVHP